MHMDTYKPTFFYTLELTHRHPLSDPCDMNVEAGTRGQERGQQGRLVHLQNIASLIHPSALRLWSIKSAVYFWANKPSQDILYQCYIFSVGCHCCCAYFFIRTFVYLNFNIAPLINRL